MEKGTDLVLLARDADVLLEGQQGDSRLAEGIRDSRQPSRQSANSAQSPEQQANRYSCLHQHCSVEACLKGRYLGTQIRFRRQSLDINTSGIMLRRVITEALNHEFSSPDPIPGWHPSKLPDGSWGAVFHGNSSALPDNLVGVLIAVRTSVGTSWTATVLEVIERSERSVRVRHSGKPSKENRS